MTLISKTKTCLGMSKVTFETNNQVQLKEILERQDIWTHKVKIERRLKNRRIHFISEGWIHVKWNVFRVTLEVESKRGAGPKEDVPDNWKLYPPCLGPRLVLGFIFVCFFWLICCFLEVLGRSCLAQTTGASTSTPVTHLLVGLSVYKDQLKPVLSAKLLYLIVLCS